MIMDLSVLKNRKIRYFLPGVLMLLLSMFALHIDVSEIGDYENLLSFYNEHKMHSAQQEGAIHAIEGFSSQAHLMNNDSYWSIIAMGLFGFVLVILNANKLSRLEAVNEEKKITLKLLSQRLAAMEATLDGIGIIDADWNVTYINRSFREMYGITQGNEEHYLGQSWYVFFPESEYAKIDTEIIPTVQSEGAWSGVFSFENLANRVVHIELEFAHIDGGGIICTARDITQRIENESDKKQMQSQLYQAQKMEAIGRLAGGIAHDFNNILAAMNGYAEFLIEDLEDGSPEHKFADNILQAGHQAKALVDQMLAFSRQKNSEFGSMDLLKPVNESLAMLRASLPKSIEVVTDFKIEAAPIAGNETQIAQIVMNLCVNAKDAMENNKGQLSLAVDYANMNEENLSGWLIDDPVEQTDMPTMIIQEIVEGETELLLGKLSRQSQYIQMSVTDTGTGMSRDVMEVVFEPFFTTKPVDKGTGLGLATAHGVIAGHGGALRIKSTVGVGTQFDLFFPVVASEEKDVAVETVIQSIEGSGNILLVEDQIEVQKMTIKMLERLGYDVDAVDDGQQALEVLREIPDHFDLVITDQNMPKVTGLELVEEIYKEQPDLPFMMLSGYSEEKLQRIIKEHPAIKMTLRKPIKKDELGKHIVHVLSLHGKSKTHAA
jgi:PAS domain S-box-containing protein